MKLPGGPELVPVGLRSPHFREVWRIYESSFPPDERRTMEQQELLSGDPRYSLLAFAVDGRIAGFISSWDLDGFAFIEHLAVHPESRGKGLGAKLLELFLKGKGDVILEAERPDSEIRKKRISFYGKAGFSRNPYDYIQPPYGPGKSPVPMLLMSYPRPLAEEEFISARAEIHREVYSLETPLV